MQAPRQGSKQPQAPERGLRRTVLGLVLLAILGLACVWLWRTEAHDPLVAWRDFPRTYLPAGTATADPDKVVIEPGGPESPPEIRRDGLILHPAYVHPEAHDAKGRPIIFAVAFTNDGQRTTPPLPPGNKPLSDAACRDLRRHQTPEGEALLQRYREEHAP